MLSMAKTLGLVVLATSCLGKPEEDFGLHTRKGDVYTEEKWIRFSEGAIGLEGQELIDYINRHQDLWTVSDTATVVVKPLALATRIQWITFYPNQARHEPFSRPRRICRLHSS